jgi:hypothetical protein
MSSSPRRPWEELGRPAARPAEELGAQHTWPLVRSTAPRRTTSSLDDTTDYVATRSTSSPPGQRRDLVEDLELTRPTTRLVEEVAFGALGRRRGPQPQGGPACPAARPAARSRRVPPSRSVKCVAEELAEQQCALVEHLELTWPIAGPAEEVGRGWRPSGWQMAGREKLTWRRRPSRDKNQGQRVATKKL